MTGKLPLFACIILFSFLTVQAQQAPKPWPRYTVPKQEFSVALPTLPAMSYYPPEHSSRWKMLLGAYADGVVYSVGIYQNKDQSLADFVAEQSAELRFDRTTEKRISNSGVAGREYSLGFPGKQLFFGTRKRFYSFMVMGAAADDPRAQQFLSSIAFGPKQDGIAVSEGLGTPYDQETDHELYVGKDVVSKARLGVKPAPRYTQEARDKHVTGTVILKVVFNSAGNVTNIRTVSGLPFGLTENAIDAAKKIKFIPAIKNGHYVSMWMQLEYNFNLY